MKKTKLAEVKKTDIKALLSQIKELLEEISIKHLDKNMGKLTNNKEIFFLRRDLAQILTVLKQKQVLENLESKNEK